MTHAREIHGPRTVQFCRSKLLLINLPSDGLNMLTTARKLRRHQRGFSVSAHDSRH